MTNVIQFPGRPAKKPAGKRATSRSAPPEKEPTGALKKIKLDHLALMFIWADMSGKQDIRGAAKSALTQAMEKGLHYGLMSGKLSDEFKVKHMVQARVAGPY